MAGGGWRVAGGGGGGAMAMSSDEAALVARLCGMSQERAVAALRRIGCITEGVREVAWSLLLGCVARAGGGGVGWVWHVRAYLCVCVGVCA